MLVGDIVTASREGALYGDVQLSSYWDAQTNLKLARAYIFTTGASSGAGAAAEVGSFELLERMVDMFQNPKAVNRMMAIANYGHGKSHFALAAANFFGKPIASQEFRAVADSLRHSTDNEGRFRVLETFREQHKPYFIVILQGDRTGDLATLFAQAINTALNAHPETHNYKAPFWFDDAATFLESLSGENIRKADAFLVDHDMDRATLSSRIRERDDTTYDLVRELFRHLFGAYPDFAGASSLSDMVKWVADVLCADDGPFGGALIIFDELSAFLGVYGGGMSTGRHAAPLQDLLNGVQQRPSRVGFIAFGVQDPREQLELALGGVRAATISKELERLEARVALRSVLEQVVNAFLRQDEDKWDQLPQREYDEVLTAAGSLTRDSLQLFADRYRMVLNWDERRFKEVVFWGCYPLHPMTTAAFSTISYSAKSNPRSVLQFVSSSLETQQGREVIEGGQISWTRPFELVDYFGEMLSDQVWPQYQSTLNQLGGDITSEQRRVLQAMLVIDAAKLPAGNAGYAKTVAAFTGLSIVEARQTLQQLADGSAIRHVPHPDRYSFWEGQASGIDELRKRKLDDIPLKLSPAMLDQAILALRDDMPTIDPSSPLGPVETWRAHQVFADVALVQNGLPNLISSIHARAASPDTSRALAVWLMPASESELDWARTQIESVVDAAVEDQAVPVMVLVPDQVPLGFANALRQWLALGCFDAGEIEKVGKDRHTQAHDAARRELKRQFDDMRKAVAITVPRYARALQKTRSRNITVVLDLLYERAYTEGPGAFFPDNKASGVFGTAIDKILPVLAGNDLRSRKDLWESNGQPKTIINWMKTRWGLLGDRYQVNAPTDNKATRHGWALLDSVIAPGADGTPLGPIIDQLLNPTYGYDHRTLPLLFAAWWGRHQHELELYVPVGSAQGAVKLTKFDELLRTGGTNGKPLKLEAVLPKLAGATISRRESGTTAADRLVREIQDGVYRVPLNEVERPLQVMVDAIETLGSDNENPKIQTYREAASPIRQAHDTAREYQEQVQRRRTIADKPKASVQDLIRVLASLPNLVAPTIVTTDDLSPHALREQLMETTAQAVRRTLEENRFQSGGDNSPRKIRLNNVAIFVKAYPEWTQVVREAQREFERDAKADGERRSLDAADTKARDALRYIAVSATSSLGDLRSALTSLDGIENGCRDAAKQEVARRRAAINEAIDQITGRITGLGKRLDAAISLSDTEGVHTETTMLLSRTGGTEEQALVEDARERAEALRTIWQRTESVPTRAPDDPKAAAAAVKDLRELRDGSILSDVQRQAIDARRRTLDASIERRKREATGWVDTAAARLVARDHIHALRDQAARPPAWLDDAGRHKLAELIVKIDGAVNEDLAGKITHQFEQMTDPIQQQELARRLCEIAFGPEMATQLARTMATSR